MERELFEPQADAHLLTNYGNLLQEKLNKDVFHRSCLNITWRNVRYGLLTLLLIVVNQILSFVSSAYQIKSCSNKLTDESLPLEFCLQCNQNCPILSSRFPYNFDAIIGLLGMLYTIDNNILAHLTATVILFVRRAELKIKLLVHGIYVVPPKFLSVKHLVNSVLDIFIVTILLLFLYFYNLRLKDWFLNYGKSDYCNGVEITFVTQSLSFWAQYILPITLFFLQISLFFRTYFWQFENNQYEVVNDVDISTLLMTRMSQNKEENLANLIYNCTQEAEIIIDSDDLSDLIREMRRESKEQLKYFWIVIIWRIIGFTILFLLLGLPFILFSFKYLDSIFKNEDDYVMDHIDILVEKIKNHVNKKDSRNSYGFVNAVGKYAKSMNPYTIIKS